MSLRVTAQNLTSRNGMVTVEGDSQEEVMSPAAKQMAIQTAMAGGINRAGISGNEVAYPVNADGETSEDLLFARNGQKVAAYRCDYNVTGGL